MKTAFVTGGASGLGREMAAQLAAKGTKVLIGDIDLAAAEATAKEIGAIAIKCDVTKEEDFQDVVTWIKKEWGSLDLLVNNAGVAQVGSLEQTSLEDWQWIVDINILGIVRACHALVPLMKPDSKMVNIASMAGLLYTANASAYCATKAAVVAISESLMQELEPKGIKVQVVCPAFFRTNLAKNMRAVDGESERMTRRLVEKAKIGAEEIAARILKGVENGDWYILTHPDYHRLWLMKRFMPFNFFMNMMLKRLRVHQSARN